MATDKGLVTDGGRPINVVGIGSSHSEAVNHAYENISKVYFDGIRYRTDIGLVAAWDRPQVLADSQAST